MTSTLGDQAYAVLTLIALRGSATAYQIERGLDLLAGEFWSAPHTQIYRECARLAAAGLLRERRENGGRRRRVYMLTKKGRDATIAWVRAPITRSMMVYDVAHLKLMAAEFSTAEDIRALAEAQAADYARRLKALDDLERRYRPRPDFALRLQSVAMGRAVYQVALDFWKGIAKFPPRP